MGGFWTKATSFFQSSGGPLIPEVSFDVVTADPATSIFTTANFPGADATTIANARGIYALLTGRLSQAVFSAKLDEITKKYSLDGTAVERNSVHGYGLY